MIEHIIGGVSRKEGFLKYQGYRLFFTNKRLIFAKMTKEMRKQEQKEMLDGLKGKGFKARLGAVMTGHKALYDKYQNVEPDIILNEHPGSFFIDRAMLKKVKQPGVTRYDDHGQQINKNIVLKTVQDKHVLKINDVHETDRAYQALKQYVKENKHL